MLPAHWAGELLHRTEERELLDLKKKWGFNDPRLTRHGKLRHLRQRRFRDGWQAASRAFDAAFRELPPRAAIRRRRTSADQDALVQAITERSWRR